MVSGPIDGSGIPDPTAFHIPDFDRIKALFSAFRERDIGSMEKANIVVAGSAGVGKSTLINAMFGAEFAKTGIGKPITARIDRIEVPGKPIALYDTRGLEIQASEDTVSDLKNLIKTLRDKEDASEQIHCLWLCIAADSGRIEDVHLDIYRLARDSKIPVIIVLTKDYLGVDDFEEVIRNEMDDVADVVSVVALQRRSSKGQEISAHGLAELLDATTAVMPEAVAASVEFAQIAAINRKIEAARGIVNWSAGTGVATAFPLSIIPFAHSAILIPLQANMIYQITRSFGVDLSEDDSKALATGVAGVIAAAVGGKMLFVELIKIIPGVGTVAGMLIGAGVAGTVVKALGEIYINFMVESINSQKVLDKASILSGLTEAIKKEAWRFKSS